MERGLVGKGCEGGHAELYCREVSEGAAAAPAPHFGLERI